MPLHPHIQPDTALDSSSKEWVRQTGRMYKSIWQRITQSVFGAQTKRRWFADALSLSLFAFSFTGDARSSEAKGHTKKLNRHQMTNIEQSERPFWIYAPPNAFISPSFEAWDHHHHRCSCLLSSRQKRLPPTFAVSICHFARTSCRPWVEVLQSHDQRPRSRWRSRCWWWRCGNVIFTVWESGFWLARHRHRALRSSRCTGLVC